MSLLNFWKSDKTFSQPVNWGITAFMVALHIAALAAVFFFTWKAFLLAVVMWWVAGSLGIGMGYHRLLTHRGYKTPKGVEYFLTICGTLAFEGGPISWVAKHRLHHQNTDKEGDPHSPRDGGFWAHMGWILTGRAMHRDRSELLPYVPDLRKDKFHLWMSNWHVIPSLVVVRARHELVRNLDASYAGPGLGRENAEGGCGVSFAGARRVGVAFAFPAFFKDSNLRAAPAKSGHTGSRAFRRFEQDL